MKKTVSVFLIIVSVVLLLGVCSAVGLSVMTYLKVNEIEVLQAEQKAANEDVDVENGVTIAGSYVIHSTQEISDAYLAGDTTKLSDRDRETLHMASDILDEIITDGMTDYEKEQAVFVWMSDNLSGDEDVTVLVRDDASTDDPHGVLSTRHAVCVGYATTFRLFMQMLDIPCMVIHDLDHIHAWDLVQIEGHWYHADLYRSVGTREPLQYLNRSDSMQREIDFNWDSQRYPAADSLEYCYAYREAESVKDVYAIPAKVKEAIDDQKPFVSLLIDNGEDVETLVRSMLYTIDETVIDSIEYEHISITHAVIEDDDKLFIYIKIEDSSLNNNGSGDLIISDEELGRINKAIYDSFGKLSYYDN